jgi:predicted amidohydrolase YtcJ
VSEADRRGATPSLVFVDVEIDGRRRQTVEVAADRITFIGKHHDAGKSRPGSEQTTSDAVIVDGRGGALLPGLHDHHLHLLSLAAQAHSVCCGPPVVRDRSALSIALRSAASRVAPGEWVRGYGYDDTALGPLDATVVDDLLGDLRDRPVRIQHRSGHQWVLNTAGVTRVRRVLRSTWLSQPGNSVRDRGVFTDLDSALRPVWSSDAVPPYDNVGARLARFGVTGVTDASVSNSRAELSLVASAQTSGALPQRVLMLGAALPLRRDPMLQTGAHKIVLTETEPPSLDALTAAIREAGARGVAVHCTTQESVVLAAVAIQQAGGGPHRIEHASVAPPEVIDLLRTLPITVVTQPGFIAEHGDRYRREVETTDHPWLYRLRSWIAAGVPLAGSTDAPFGNPDPWAAINAAVTRQTADGAILGEAERLTPEQALRLFLSPLHDPGGPPRQLAIGSTADLCLLSLPWNDARRQLDRHLVRATFVGGRQVYGG